MSPVVPSSARRQVQGVRVGFSNGPNLRNRYQKAHPLARWLEQLTIVRNTCAHHSRVWNRSCAPVSTAGLRTIPDLRSLPEGLSERLYGALAVMGHLLQSTSPGTTWTTKVRLLVEESFDGISIRNRDGVS